MKDPKAFIDSFDASHFTEAADAFSTIADSAQDHAATLTSKIELDMDSKSWTGKAAKQARKMFKNLHNVMDDAHGEAKGMFEMLTDIGGRLGDAQSEVRKQIEALEGEELAYNVYDSLGGGCTVQVYGVKLKSTAGCIQGDHDSILEESVKAWEEKYGKDYTESCTAYETSIGEALVDAIEADEELSLVLKESFLSDNAKKPSFNGEPLIDLDPGVIEDGLPPKDATPEEVKDWWDSLSEDEQQYFIEHEPGKVGDLDGVPVTARDEANRIYIEDRPDQIDEEMKQLQEDYENGKISKIDYYAEMAALSSEKTFIGRVDDSLDKEPGNGQQRYLIDVDPKVDQAVISTGNPDTADSLAVYVPGTDGSYYLETQVGRTDALQAEAANADPNSETAAVMWLGYDTPEFDLESPPTDSEYAIEGGPKLNDFMDTMRTTHQGSPANTTVIGHSYGSSVVGTADAQGDGLGADNIVVAGSPGLGYDENGNEINHVDQLNTDPDHVWAAAADDDWIPDLGDPHGESPDEEEVGAEQLFVDTSGHSGYWDEGSQSLENQGNIITGNYDDVIVKK